LGPSPGAEFRRTPPLGAGAVANGVAGALEDASAIAFGLAPDPV